MVDKAWKDKEACWLLPVKATQLAQQSSYLSSSCLQLEPRHYSSETGVNYKQPKLTVIHPFLCHHRCCHPSRYYTSRCHADGRPFSEVEDSAETFFQALTIFIIEHLRKTFEPHPQASAGCVECQQAYFGEELPKIAAGGLKGKESCCMEAWEDKKQLNCFVYVVTVMVGQTTRSQG